VIFFFVKNGLLMTKTYIFPSRLRNAKKFKEFNGEIIIMIM
jgi:hypothetical protein